MKVLEIVPSRERCAESGWYAYDFCLDTPMDEEFIRSLKGLGGSFLFLTMLKAPFFKLESHHYVVKGVLGNDYFRLAVHEADAESEKERILRWMQEQA